MTDLRTIVAQMVSGAPFPSKRSQNKAIDILDAIDAAGFRILGPDEVDPATLEKCVAAAESMSPFVSDGPTLRLTNQVDIASAIRALGRKA